MSTTTPDASTEQPEHVGDTEPGFHCESCDAYFIEEGDTALYECSDDGVFGSDEGNRCPQCNKFAARIGNACPECDEGPVEDATVFHCERCDAYFEDGDQDDHQHEDDEDDDEARAAKGHARSTHAQPVLGRKRVADLVKGDVVARPWAEGSPGAERARTADGAPYNYLDVGSVEQRSDGMLVWSGNMGLSMGQADDEVQVVTGWGRPPGAYEIKARDLRLDHIRLPDPDDWTKRNGYREVTHDLVTGEVTCDSGRGRRSAAVTFGPDETLTVVGVVGKRNLIGNRAWRVRWDRPFAPPLATIDGSLTTNPDYEAAAPLRKALHGAGIVDGRKIMLRRDSAIIVDKRPDLAQRLVEILREHGYTPTEITEYEQTRY